MALSLSSGAKLAFDGCKRWLSSQESFSISGNPTANKSQTSTVAIINPATGKILTMFKNNPNKAEYTKILDSALANI
ncbi:hypothetical protein [Nostoc sp. PCC 7524]|uniref:hypothetical protein n=1 Tax=Nostoc sp. (strain ATCC 29411 / PCC 7524) TaxID=28072 RepID=UPI00059FE931|nr:hypothetical protein [Nostoc sp. PCC 7524]